MTAAVEAKAEMPPASASAKKLGHFRLRPYFHNPYHIKPAQRMPYKYHPYFNFYRQHVQKEKKGEETETEMMKEDKADDKVVPFQPYLPYFHRQHYYNNPYYHQFDPYFYYNYHKKG